MWRLPRNPMQPCTWIARACAMIVIVTCWADLLDSRSATSGRLGRTSVAAQSSNNCTQLAPLVTGNRTVNIAMLFWGPPANDTRFTDETGAARIRWPRNPILEGWDGPSSVEIRFMRPYLLWEERMELPAAYGGGPGLILLDGSVMRLNLTWFDVGEFSAVKGSGEFTPQSQNSWANTIIKQLADANGPYGRQHFIMSPLMSNSQVTILASLACEASGTCMMVSPGATESRMFICQDPMPHDCLERGRRKGSRRFENTVSPSSNTDYWASGSMSLVVNQGFKRIFAIGELWSVNAMTQMSATAKLLGMQVVGSLLIATQTKDWRDYNTSSAALTQRIKDLNVDMVVVLNTFEGTTALHDLLRHWRAINFLPNAVAYLTGGASYLPPDLAAYFLVEVHWLPTLTGAQYRAVSTETNFETFPANATHDSPIVFADAFTERFGYRPSDNVFFDSVRAFHAVTLVQKLLELAQTEDTESLKRAAARIAAPAVYHSVQFDQWGRSLPFDKYVMQLMPDGEARVLTPLGLGTTPILPIPGWSEREYKPVFLAKTSERVAFSLAAVTVLYLLGWLVWLISQRHHPLIRVADPLFYAFSLCGLIVLASACFFSTFLQSDATCAAFQWLFIPGLTLSFAPLVLKNLRIWSLWHNSASFTPAPIRQWHTVCALCALLLIDVAALSVWQLSTGLVAIRVSPDPYRPSRDYLSCKVDSHNRAFIVAIMSWKLLMLALAMYLAYLLRNVTSKYSESRFIALCVYNVTVTLAIFMPVSATKAAGHQWTHLIRSYLLLFLCVSTASIMFVPKLIAVRRLESVDPDPCGSETTDMRARSGSDFMTDESRQQPGQSMRARTELPHPPRAQTGAGVVGHVAHSAPVSTAAHATHIHPPALWLPASTHPVFQSVIGLSQIERGVEADSQSSQSQQEHKGQRHGQGQRAKSVKHTPRLSECQRRRSAAAGADLRSPAPLLASLPPLSAWPVSQSPPSLLYSTLHLLSLLPSAAVEELYSSLMQQRHAASWTADPEPEPEPDTRLPPAAVSPVYLAPFSSTLQSPSDSPTHAGADDPLIEIVIAVPRGRTE